MGSDVNHQRYDLGSSQNGTAVCAREFAGEKKGGIHQRLEQRCRVASAGSNGVGCHGTFLGTPTAQRRQMHREHQCYVPELVFGLGPDGMGAPLMAHF